MTSETEFLIVTGIALIFVILAIVYDLTFNDPLYKADQERQKKK